MYYTKTETGYIIRVRVTPNSSRNTIAGTFADNNSAVYLKINIQGVPEKGKANQELIKYLSKLLHINKSCFELLSGETERYKKLLIKIPPNQSLEELLKELEQSHDSNNIKRKETSTRDS